MLKDRVCWWWWYYCYYYYKNAVCSILNILERTDGGSILNMMTKHSHVIIVHMYPLCSVLFLHDFLACICFSVSTKYAALEKVTPMNFLHVLAFCFDLCSSLCMQSYLSP